MKNTSKKNRIAQTLQQAAKLLKVSLSEVKTAKRNGADCFLASGRIDLIKLQKYLQDHPFGQSSRENTDDQLAPVDLSSLESSLLAAISVEEENLRMLRAAQVRADALAVGALTDAFQKAQKNRLLCEKDVRRQKLEAGQLLTLDSHKAQLFKLWRPIVDAIRRVPRKAAAHLGGDTLAVEKTLDAEIEAAIAEAKGICFPTTDQEKTWARCSLLKVICAENGRFNAASLEHIDALRSFAMAELAKQKQSQAPVAQT